MFNPSSYNQAIADAFKAEKNRNLAVNAVAGSGKTSQIKWLCELNQNVRKLYLVFSKEMQVEAEPKLLPFGCEVRTFHSFGYLAIRNTIKAGRPGCNWKYHNLIDETEFKESRFGISKNQATKILSIIRNWYYPINPATVMQACEHWVYYPGREFESNIEEFCQILEWIDNQGISDEGLKSGIHFDDMQYAPLKRGFQFPSYPEIFVDEVQDLNNAREEILKRITNSRITIVGDPHQAIMGFSGANEDSFSRLEEGFNTITLPLSVCYRCPDNVLELAKAYVPHIEGTGKEGVFNNLSYNELIDTAKPNDLIICRVNAPLVSLAFKMMAKGKKCRLKGRNFAETIIRLSEDCKRFNNQFDSFRETLDHIVNERIAKTKSEGKIANLLDAQECLETLYEEAESFTHLKKIVEDLFNDDDDKNFISLSSIHRSKGLERETVTILTKGDNLTPPGCGQESNLSYVALTRTTHKLNFVKLPKR